ncbi:MAG TPA: tRNA uridine-5-carboxymethylaminomethyl(34) synthesis enzyme MnmG, partial [Devosia sp.]|nr:tRNA uridine-5-carboxymethylaminomethyl(34) synthesis enzyme MnmG [Devosia sp.]
RLHLRSDNADQRLTPLGVETGLVGPERSEHFARKSSALRAGRAMLGRLTTTPSEAQKAGIAVNADGQQRTAFDLLAYPGVEADDIKRRWPEIGELAPATLEQLSIDAQYAVYLERQKADVAAMRRDESIAIPGWVDYGAIPGLSMELRQKLTGHQPATIAQAQAIEGMTPAAATLLLAIIRRGALRKAG